MTQTERGINELKAAGMFDQDSDYNGGIGDAVKELLEVFGKQGHSGFSAMRTAEIFHRLVKGESLVPLKGTPDEWNEAGHGVWQNNRVSSVFASGPNGERAHWIYGVVFVHGNSACTGRGSQLPVRFPWRMPKTTRRPYWMMRLYRWRLDILEKLGVW